MLWPFLFLWQMLLPLFELADLFCYSILQLYYGWCYCHVADVITTVVVILICCWQMLLPCGRWKSHFFVRLVLLPSGRWNGHCRVWAPLVWCYFQRADGRVILFQFEFWGVMQNLIPYVKQMFNNFSIVGREDQNLCRWIKEALYIRVNNPSLNKNIGKYHLLHIWDEVLHNTSELKLK